ncbi:MAG: DUF1080 domain-containing protein [Gemmatimonadetes bacterium]|nr:DUF1080 domain-containing protein [Gemmatimonadota bacterium]
MSDLRRTSAVALLVFGTAACGLAYDAEAGADSLDDASTAQAHNTLTPEEEAAGWLLLFDGESTDGWRGYNQDAFPEEGWAISDGNLIVFASDGSEEGLGGDIVTERSFESFELTFDFNVSPVGNSGVFYRVQEVPGAEMWHHAPEYQVLDDTAYIEMGTMDMNKHLTGDNYDLHASRVTASRPIGEWNTGRIIVDGNHVEHWLNGQLTVSYEIASPEWNDLVAGSKFAPYEGHGLATSGPIGIQDHGHEIRYRNVKIRPIERPDGESERPAVSLFNGTDLEGWTIHGTERWYVEDGTLVCESGPDAQYGYLLTQGDYRDFDLTLEFKQEADGNSGVFFRSTVDGTTVTGWQAEVAPPGLFTGGIYESYGRGWLIQPPPERDQALRMGDWNRMRIRAVGPRVTTWVNGTEMVDIEDAGIGEGQGGIALQIHDGGGIKVRWRNIRIREL